MNEVQNTEAIGIYTEKNIEYSWLYSTTDIVQLTFIGICIYFCVKILFWIYHLIITNFLYNKNIITPHTKEKCDNVFCNTWVQSCDIYLQMSGMKCRKAIKCYVGTLLGDPQDIEMHIRIANKDVLYKKNWFFDIIEIDTKLAYIKYNKQRYYLPNNVTVPLLDKFLGRHLHSKNNVTYKLIMLTESGLITDCKTNHPFETGPHITGSTKASIEVNNDIEKQIV